MSRFEAPVIVADTNLAVYLFVPGPHTGAATEVLAPDSVWMVPRSYSYELLNVMATHVRNGIFDLDHAFQVIDQVERTVQVIGDPDRKQVLTAAVAVSIGSYDCEFVVLARELGTRVVTADKRMLNAFSDLTISIEDFAAGK
jgi:predicted nucleic acid-binding protein